MHFQEVDSQVHVRQGTVPSDRLKAVIHLFLEPPECERAEALALGIFACPLSCPPPVIAWAAARAALILFVPGSNTT